MDNSDKLKYARNLLLGLHKNLVDFERSGYERINGPLSAGQFLNVLLEDQDFSWLRKFSMLIVEIDEMFALKDGIPAELIDANLVKVRELVDMSPEDEYFRAKYRNALDKDADAAASHARLEALFQ
ncbi:MAG: hypothetical protein ACK4S4_06415 [Pyrinomonadaceae bacterium]